eukprot:scaffold115108_cov28-Tisochrysis_lutea.AAC.4
MRHCNASHKTQSRVPPTIMGSWHWWNSAHAIHSVRLAPAENRRLSPASPEKARTVARAEMTSSAVELASASASCDALAMRDVNDPIARERSTMAGTTTKVVKASRQLRAAMKTSVISACERVDEQASKERERGIRDVLRHEWRS